MYQRLYFDTKNTFQALNFIFTPKKKRSKAIFLTPFLKIGRVKFPLSKLPNLRTYRFRIAGKLIFLPHFFFSPLQTPRYHPPFRRGWSSCLPDHFAYVSLQKNSKKIYNYLCARLLEEQNSHSTFFGITSLSLRVICQFLLNYSSFPFL